MKISKTPSYILFFLLMLLLLKPSLAFANQNLDEYTIDITNFREKLKKESKSISFVKLDDFNQVKDDYIFVVDISKKSSNGKIHLYQSTNSDASYAIVNQDGGPIYFDEASGSMFSSFKNLTNLSFNNIDTRNVIYMNSMFNGCSSLKNLDLSAFNTKNVISMSEMFSGCSSLEAVDLSSFDTSSVKNMYNMFYGCSSLEKLNLSNFNTENVLKMQYMFKNCSSLADLDISNFETKSVQDMTGMFHKCEKLQVLDLHSFDTSKVTNMQHMFEECQSLHTIYASEKFQTNFGYDIKIFQGCENLKGEKGTTYDSNVVNNKYARLDGGEKTPGYFSRKPFDISIDDMGYKLLEFVPKSGKKGEEITLKISFNPNMDYEFKGIEAIKPQDLQIKEVPNTSFQYQFTMPEEEVNLKVLLEKVVRDQEDQDDADEQEDGENQVGQPEENNLLASYLSNLIFSPREVKQDTTNKQDYILKSQTLINIGSKILKTEINGKESQIEMDVSPYIENGRTFIPIRFVGQALGFKVSWLEESKTAILEDDKTLIQIPILTNKIIVNDITYESDTIAYIKEGRTMVAIGNISRALGLKDGVEIFWDQENQRATINLVKEK